MAHISPADRPDRTSDRGAAAEEFGLVLPLLLLLLVGIVRFGQVWNAQITMTQAAREGVRVAALNQTNPSGATTDAALPLQGITVNVTGCPTPADPTKTAQVLTSKTISLAPLPNVMALTGGTVTSPVTVTGKARMRCTG